MSRHGPLEDAHPPPETEHYTPQRHTQHTWHQDTTRRHYQAYHKAPRHLAPFARPDASPRHYCPRTTHPGQVPPPPPPSRSPHPTSPPQQLLHDTHTPTQPLSAGAETSLAQQPPPSHRTQDSPSSPPVPQASLPHESDSDSAPSRHATTPGSRASPPANNQPAAEQGAEAPHHLSAPPHQAASPSRTLPGLSISSANSHLRSEPPQTLRTNPPPKREPTAARFPRRAADAQAYPLLPCRHTTHAGHRPAFAATQDVADLIDLRSRPS
jgi:hypothetical protein